eukprot:jgi/Mesvir1/9668/Mv12153-RA.1
MKRWGPTGSGRTLPPRNRSEVGVDELCRRLKRVSGALDSECAQAKGVRSMAMAVRRGPCSRHRSRRIPIPSCSPYATDSSFRRSARLSAARQSGGGFSSGTSSASGLSHMHRSSSESRAASGQELSDACPTSPSRRSTHRTRRSSASAPQHARSAPAFELALSDQESDQELATSSGSSSGPSTCMDGRSSSPSVESVEPESAARGYRHGAAAGDTWNSFIHALVGLHNLGNTCYANSCIQCLVSIPPLMESILRSRVSRTRSRISSENRPRGLARGFTSLVHQLRRSGAAVSPDALMEQMREWRPQFKGATQHDAQEFLRSLLDGLHEELNRIWPDPPRVRDLSGHGSPLEQGQEAWLHQLSRQDSVIQDIFGGQLQSTIVCQMCGKSSHCFDLFLDLSLQINKKGGRAGGSSSKGGGKGGVGTAAEAVDLHDCLADFTSQESLDASERFWCKWCQAHRPIMKTMSIFRFPWVLVLHIKRFTKTIHSYLKDNTLVRFSLNSLDLTRYQSPLSLDVHAGTGPPIYDLLAVSNHEGNMRGGHYNAVCRLSPSSSRWFSFNDSVVSETSPASIVTPSAYLLFYMRQGKGNAGEWAR